MITSVHNPHVKRWKKLRQRKYREKMQQFIIEGDHLIEMARRGGWTLTTVIIRQGNQVPAWCATNQMELVDDHVFNEIAQTETPQGIAAIVEMKKNALRTDNKPALLIDAVQDPGNLGTIIRTADAAGFPVIYLGVGTVDVYNEKVIRATQGSIFNVDIMHLPLEEVILQLQQQNYTVWASTLTKATSLYNAQFSDKTALILGNEGAGVRADLIQLAGNALKVPIYGKAESLNVGIAGGIMMYHIRQNLHN